MSLPTRHSYSTPPSLIPGQYLYLSAPHIPNTDDSSQPDYGQMLTEIIGKKMISNIPTIPTAFLKLFPGETTVLPRPYLPDIFPEYLEPYYFNYHQHQIHAAKGISKYGRSFLALRVEVATEKNESFQMIEMMFQKSLHNSEEFIGVPNNTTDFYGGAISSIYDGNLIEKRVAQLLRSLLRGQTIESPTAARFGKIWRVRAV